MNSDPTVRPPAPWPRFTRPATARPPRALDPAPHDPWPRWGWFPREQRTWTFAPGPALVADPAPAPTEAAPEPLRESVYESVQEAAPGVESAPGAPEAVAAVDYLPVARPVTMALVPAGLGDVTLAEVARAARRAAPAAAALGMAAVAAMAFFRRR